MSFLRLTGGATVMVLSLGCSQWVEESAQDPDPCTPPSSSLSFGTGVDCSQQSYEHDVSGSYTGTSKGFRVDSGVGESLVITGVGAEIPDGTLVRARFWCASDVWAGGTSQFLYIENLPTLDAMRNPTEQGGRLWLVAGGGWGSSTPGDFPFALDEQTVCVIPSSSADPHKNDETQVQRLTLSGEGVNVTAQPGEAIPFTIQTGNHAGSYRLENVNVILKASGLHLHHTRNFAITRAN